MRVPLAEAWRNVNAKGKAAPASRPTRRSPLSLQWWSSKSARSPARLQTPRLVPVAHLKQFVLGLRPEDDASHDLARSLARTSDHEMAEAGFSMFG